ncbi:MAG: pilus assembly protein [Rhizobiales bacterium]|nr:pilus assembly protein [Hyphomicrobiales bacterium]
MRRALRSLLHRFRRAREGSASVLLAIGLPSLLALAGGAVDYTAATQSQSRLQGVADAAALSIAREMTLSPMTPQRVQLLAASHVQAALGGEASEVQVVGTLAENNTAILVVITAPLRTPLGLLPKLTGETTLQSKSLARVNTSSSPTKLCVLSLGEYHNGGIFMHNGSMLNAPECMLYSNSTHKSAVIVQQGSQLTANMVCARGGVSNMAGQVRATLVNDCPIQRNPLDTKPEPPLQGACLQNKLTIKDGIRTLSPGVYCKGVTIEGTARVTLNPGIYIFRDGPLTVRQNAEFAGQGVTLMFTGKKSYFRFLDNSLIRISAPSGGASAGMLLWEARSFQPGLNSWKNGGCGGGDDDDDDAGANNCGPPVPGVVPPKKTNEHHINSDRARELTGTIYLRNGLLLIDSRRPVADQSPFTVMVVNKLDLYDGPNLMLNSNFAGASVPVPQGLGPLGSKQVRLGM